MTSDIEKQIWGCHHWKKEVMVAKKNWPLTFDGKTQINQVQNANLKIAFFSESLFLYLDIYYYHPLNSLVAKLIKCVIKSEALVLSLVFIGPIW